MKSKTHASKHWSPFDFSYLIGQKNREKIDEIQLPGLVLPRHNLDSVVGQDKLVKELGELVALINNPILAELYFIKTGKSSFTKYLLFEGPTGSGKTYMAEA
ncbi:MAG: hypothetical protein ACRCXZ_03700, partial [Patescibacteria group bacterium]